MTWILIEQLGDRIDSFEELPNQNKVAIDRIDEKFDEKFKDQSEIHQDIKQTLGNKIQGLAERIEPLEELPENIKKMSCPVGGQYKSINGVCYFFDATNRNFDQAQANCKQIFGPTGKIYEPKTETEARIFYDSYKLGILSSYTWVGITDRETEGVYKYASSGIVVPESALFWNAGYPHQNSGNQDCVCNTNVEIKTPLGHRSCSTKFQSICEW